MSSGKYYRVIAKPSEINSELTFKDVILSFSDITTIHGIPHVTRANGVVKRAWWIVLGILASFALITHIVLITRLYLSYSVSVSITLEHEPELDFPAVTICNMSPVRKSLYNAAVADGKLLGNNNATETGTTRRRRKRALSEMYVTGDDYLPNVYVNEESLPIATTSWRTAKYASWSGDTLVIAIECVDTRGNGGILASTSIGVVTDATWKCTNLFEDNWYSVNFDDSHWPQAVEVQRHSASGYWVRVIDGIDLDAFWIWTEDLDDNHIYCRKKVQEEVTYLVEQSDEDCDCPCCSAANDLYEIVVEPVVADPLEEEIPLSRNGSDHSERLALREDFTEAEEVLETLADADSTLVSELGYTIQDLILDCQYAGSYCSFSRDFESFHNPVHGNCYTFNSGWNNAAIKSKRTGKRHGLELVMNVGQDDYISEMADAVGMRLVIHPQNRMPFPEDEGLTLTPGRITYIGVRQIEIQRLSGNYGSCRDNAERNADANVYEEHYNVEYSLMACLKTCHQKHVISRCSCADAYIPVTGAAFGNEEASICSVTNVTQDDCMYEVQKMFENNELRCDCPNPCRNTLYDVRNSFGLWPSDVQRASVLSKFATKVPELMNDTADPEKYSRNLLKASIYFEEFNYESIEEEIDYPSSQYASDLGGVLGLWFGVSLFTVAELVELFVDSMVIKYRTQRSKDTQKDVEKAANKKKKPNRLEPLKNGTKNKDKLPSIEKKENPKAKISPLNPTSDKTRSEQKNERRRQTMKNTAKAKQNNQTTQNSSETPVVEFKY